MMLALQIAFVFLRGLQGPRAYGRVFYIPVLSLGLCASIHDTTHRGEGNRMMTQGCCIVYSHIKNRN